MNSTKSRRTAIFVTILVGLLTTSLVGSTSASATGSYVTWVAPNDTSYAVAMPTHKPDGTGGSFEVQPGDPNHNSTSTWAGGGVPSHQAELILKAWYSAGLGYYWFYVRCESDPYYPHVGATIIGRGSFIPDYQRPYVGIFYQPDGNLVMYKYAKDSAGNRTDSWVVGALYTQPGGSTSFDAFGSFERGSYLSQSYC